VLLSNLGRIRAITPGPGGNLYIVTSNTTPANGSVDKIVRLVVVEDIVVEDESPG